MEKETIEMRFYPEGILPERACDQESASTLEEMEAYLDECAKSYTEFLKRNHEAEAKWTKDGVVDYEAWEREDPDEFFEMGLAEFNGFNGLDLLEYEIEMKKKQIARRQEMGMELWFYEADDKQRRFTLDANLQNGYGVMVTPKIGADDKVNFLLEVPVRTESNHIDFGKPVKKEIADMVTAALGCPIADEVRADGRKLREFIADRLGGTGTLEGEKNTAELLRRIGVNYLCMDDGMIVLETSKINVIRCEDD